LSLLRPGARPLGVVGMSIGPAGVNELAGPPAHSDGFLRRTGVPLQFAGFDFAKPVFPARRGAILFTRFIKQRGVE